MITVTHKHPTHPDKYILTTLEAEIWYGSFIQPNKMPRLTMKFLFWPYLSHFHSDFDRIRSKVGSLHVNSTLSIVVLVWSNDLELLEYQSYNLDLILDGLFIFVYVPNFDSMRGWMETCVFIYLLIILLSGTTKLSFFLIIRPLIVKYINGNARFIPGILNLLLTGWVLLKVCHTPCILTLKCSLSSWYRIQSSMVNSITKKDSNQGLDLALLVWTSEFEKCIKMMWMFVRRNKVKKLFSHRCQNYIHTYI